MDICYYNIPPPHTCSSQLLPMHHAQITVCCIFGFACSLDCQPQSILFTFPVLFVKCCGGHLVASFHQCRRCRHKSRIGIFNGKQFLPSQQKKYLTKHTLFPVMPFWIYLGSNPVGLYSLFQCNVESLWQLASRLQYRHHMNQDQRKTLIVFQFQFQFQFQTHLFFIEINMRTNTNI